MSERQLPAVVIGAGPVGLAAAAHLLERGLEPLVLERGDSAAANVADWGHVRLFRRGASTSTTPRAVCSSRAAGSSPTPKSTRPAAS